VSCKAAWNFRTVAIKSHIADSIQLLVHIERQHGKRLVSQILEIQGYMLETDKYEFNALFEN
jgi:Flp pilus assembly CpaF family ATPase